MRLRPVVVEALALGAGAALLWWLARNTHASLAERGITLGFAFLRQSANFDIGDAPLDYTPEDSFARAILVGLANTARVSVLGWILATVLGFMLGLMRLSDNPALRALTRGWVELLRNIPLLLLLLFFAATVHELPSPQNAVEFLPGMFVSDRGMVLPRLRLEPLHLWLGALLIGTLAFAFASLGSGAGFVFGTGSVGSRLDRLAWPLVVTCIVVLGAALSITPPGWSQPRLDGFNFTGGLTLSPELAALLAGLVLHHAAHISEIVRGAVVAVPRGQRDAAHALGLSRMQAMRHVIVPQALRAMTPLLASNWVSLTKNSSLAVAIGFPDVVSILNTTSNQSGHAIETMVIMLAVYLTLSLTVAAAFGAYNSRLLRPGY